MPTYDIVIGDESTYPDYAYNEVITGQTKVYDVGLLTPLHTEHYITVQYNRMTVTTKYLDMTSRGPASDYHGALAPQRKSDYHLMADYSRRGYKPSESPVGRSLTSKPKTGGINSYKPKQGAKCAPGYRSINGMCVKK